MVVPLLALITGLSSGDFLQVPAAKYRIGKAGHVQNPPRWVRVGSFRIAKFETTNEQFGAFVQATGYVTDAERLHNGMVFEPPLPEFRWIRDRSATWRFPNGKTRGSIEGKGRHPVTSISFADALAYCKWAHVRLPTLSEWEVACRAGMTGDYFFGSSAAKIGAYANVWHGRNHTRWDDSDGYRWTSPVGSFKPNPWGLYDMYGNVFEFCSGTLMGDRSALTRHSRGGSWWCSASSCCFFNSADIGNVGLHASFSNQGFRVVEE